MNLYILILMLFAAYLLGCVVTYAITMYNMNRNPDGIFYVNLDDPNDDFFRLQIDLAVEQIPDAKFLLFKVVK